MYNNYEQLQTDLSRSNTVRTEKNYATSTSAVFKNGTTYRSTMTPRVTSLGRSRSVGFGAGSTASRAHQTYNSSNYSSSFAPSLYSLVNIYGVAMRGCASTASIASTNGVTPRVHANRLRDKRDLVFLNDKFAQYVEKVRYLEAHNRKLLKELEYLRGRTGQGSTKIKDMYETEMTEASKLVAVSKRNLVEAFEKTAAADDELKRQKARYNNLSMSRVTDQKEYDLILQQYADNEAQIAVFRRRIADLNDELRLYKVEGQRLTTEIANVQNQIRAEISLRSVCDLDRAALNEEILSLKESHEVELTQIRSRIVSVDIDPSRFFRNELALAIRDIRQEYEAVVESQRIELQSRYSIVINEISYRAQRQETPYTNGEEQVREVERMRADLLAAQNQTTHYRGKVQQLEHAINDIRLKIKNSNESSSYTISRIENDIAQAREYLLAIEENHKKVMASKVTLEQEITTYRRYLESPEGLRGCVDRIVQNAEQQNYERTTGSYFVYAGRTKDATTVASSVYGDTANYATSYGKSSDAKISNVDSTGFKTSYASSNVFNTYGNSAGVKTYGNSADVKTYGNSAGVKTYDKSACVKTSYGTSSVSSNTYESLKANSTANVVTRQLIDSAAKYSAYSDNTVVATNFDAQVRVSASPINSADAYTARVRVSKNYGANGYTQLSNIQRQSLSSSTGNLVQQCVTTEIPNRSTELGNCVSSSYGSLPLASGHNQCTDDKF